MAKDGISRKGAVTLIVPYMGAMAVVLQLRGELNPEKNFASESFPGAAQLSAHGGLEEGETFLQSAQRELREELGIDLPPEAFTLVYTHTDEKQEVQTFCVRSTLEELAKAKLHAGSGGLRLITKDQLGSIRLLDKAEKQAGVTNRKDIAMFPDAVDALKEVFKHIDA